MTDVRHKIGRLIVIVRVNLQNLLYVLLNAPFDLPSFGEPYFLVKVFRYTVLGSLLIVVGSLMISLPLKMAAEHIDLSENLKQVLASFPNMLYQMLYLLLALLTLGGASYCAGVATTQCGRGLLRRVPRKWRRRAKAAIRHALWWKPNALPV